MKNSKLANHICDIGSPFAFEEIIETNTSETRMAVSKFPTTQIGLGNWRLRAGFSHVSNAFVPEEGPNLTGGSLQTDVKVT